MNSHDAKVKHFDDAFEAAIKDAMETQEAIATGKAPLADIRWLAIRIMGRGIEAGLRCPTAADDDGTPTDEELERAEAEGRAELELGRREARAEKDAYDKLQREEP